MAETAQFDFVRKIHAAGTRLVLAVTGGGSGAIGALVQTPGASRSVLEAVVPYSAAALADWLGARPEKFCDPATARGMAMAAFQRARRWAESDDVAGVACTASLASDRPKRGPHRLHAAAQTVGFTATASLELVKDRRGRAEEEAIGTLFVLNQAALACGLDDALPLPLVAGETVERQRIDAPAEWRELLLGRRPAVCDGEPSASLASPPNVAVYAGAFHPLHEAHRRIAEIAERMLGMPVVHELSIENVDKPPLDYAEIARRLGQFADRRRVWLTRAATFVEKSRLFPGAAFVVGADTLARVGDPRYYGGRIDAMRGAIAEIAARGCRFLVFGRLMGGKFCTLSDLSIPAELASLCREIPADVFREDVSSTELRQRADGTDDINA